MITDQFIALSASLGTVLSAFATLWTVRQMRRQRELSYLPDLMISRMYFEGSHVSGDVKYSLLNGWNPSPSAKVGGEECFMFYMPLRNVGLGAAKNISVMWSFPIEEIVRQLNDLGQKTLPSVHFIFEAGKVSIQSERFGNHELWSWFEQQKVSLEYLLPVTVQREPVKLAFPLLFTQLCSFLNFLHEKNNDRNSMQNFPVIKAHFEYFDIGGKCHKADFYIKVQLHEAGGEGRIISGELESMKCA